MLTNTKSRLTSIFINILHTLCVFVVTLLPFMLESVYKTDYNPLILPDITWRVAYLILSATSLVFYYVASCANPGYVPIPKYCGTEDSEDDDDDEKSTEVSKMVERDMKSRHCGFCGIRQPLRARHCESCVRCVRRFDHHCPWLGNCVGEGNHRYFILFLITTSVGLGWSVYLVWNSNQTTTIHPSSTTFTDNLRWVSLVVLSFLSLPLCALSLVHVYLIFSNVTAWEFTSRHRISYLRDMDWSDENPFHLGCLRNAFAVLCARSYQSWEKVYERFVSEMRRKKGTAFDC